MAKPAPPHAVVLGDARITINAIPAQVFEALTNAERLVEWWGDDVRVDAQIGGVYEATPRSDDHDDRGSPQALLCVAALERGSIRRDHGGVRTLSERAADRRARYPPLSRNGGGGLGCHVAAGARLAEVLSRDAAAGIRWLSRTEGRGAEHFFNPSRFEVRGVSMPVSPIRKLNSIWVHVRD